jgi:uncharacterized protein (DUF983 family)
MLIATAATRNSIPARLRSIAAESGKRVRYVAIVTASSGQSAEPGGEPAGESAGRSAGVQPITDFPSRPRLLARGITRRCAWCGDRRAYFTGWFGRQERCRSCGHAYRRGDEAFELGAITANIILTFLSILLTILVLVALTAPDVPVIGVTVAAGAIALVGPALFYPVSFTLWQAVDLWMRRPTPDELAGRGDARL